MYFCLVIIFPVLYFYPYFYIQVYTWAEAEARPTLALQRARVQTFLLFVVINKMYLFSTIAFSILWENGFVLLLHYARLFFTINL